MLKDLFSTKMFCQDSNAAESAYMQALNQVNEAKMSEGKLQLFNRDQLLLVFKKAD